MVIPNAIAVRTVRRGARHRQRHDKRALDAAEERLEQERAAINAMVDADKRK